MGWRDIGYHYGLEKVGGRYQILFGRMPIERGAHCYQQGMNRKSLGICCVGNFDESPPPEAQLKLLERLVDSLMRIYVIPLSNIKRHSDYATYKSCPGTQFPWEQFIIDLEGMNNG
jgi:N-acetyl-anhydromuramyl-L-alanine amidase AmpD